MAHQPDFTGRTLNPIGPNVYFERLRPRGRWSFLPYPFIIRLKGFHHKQAKAMYYRGRMVVCKPDNPGPTTERCITFEGSFPYKSIFMTKVLKN